MLWYTVLCPLQHFCLLETLEIEPFATFFSFMRFSFTMMYKWCIFVEEYLQLRYVKSESVFLLYKLVHRLNGYVDVVFVMENCCMTDVKVKHFYSLDGDSTSLRYH